MNIKLFSKPEQRKLRWRPERLKLKHLVRCAHLKKLSVKVSTSSFAIPVNLLRPLSSCLHDHVFVRTDLFPTSVWCH